MFPPHPPHDPLDSIIEGYELWARGFAKPALVFDQAASRLDPTGFDPARVAGPFAEPFGDFPFVPRQLTNNGRK